MRIRAGAAIPQPGATRATTTEASTTGTAVLDDQVGRAGPGRDGQAFLPAVEVLEPGGQAVAARCRVCVARVVNDGYLIEVGDVDSVAASALPRGKAARPDPAADGLLGAMRAPCRLPDGDLPRCAHE